MRLNAFSSHQYRSSSNAEYYPTSTQREGEKKRQKVKQIKTSQLQGVLNSVGTIPQVEKVYKEDNTIYVLYNNYDKISKFSVLDKTAQDLDAEIRRDAGTIARKVKHQLSVLA